MELNEFQEAAERTIRDFGDFKMNMAHMVIGMGSELNELSWAIIKQDKVNIGEEITDIHWYLANYCRLNGILYSELESDSREVYHVAEWVSKIQDLEKRHMVYDTITLPVARLYHAQRIFLALKRETFIYNLDIKICMRNLIDKLIIRFPDKFTTYLANNRNLIAERAELEKN